jgi:hypothetical protein
MPALIQLRPLNPMMSPALIPASPGSTSFRLNGNIATLPARIDQRMHGVAVAVILNLSVHPAILTAILVDHRWTNAANLAEGELQRH